VFNATEYTISREVAALDTDIARRVIPISTCWAVEELWGISATEILNSMDIMAMFGQSSEPQAMTYTMEDGGIAVLKLEGVLTKAPTCAYDYMGGTSTVLARRALRTAEKDPAVNKILLHIDSPGGDADGTAELANEVRRISQSGSKPILAYIDGYGASAAYWIPSQCDAMYSSVSSNVGSIGTYMVLRDSSKMASDMGITVHVIRAGKYKGAGTPGTKITKDVLDKFQRQVDAVNRLFTRAVASGRGFDVAKMDAIATGETWLGEEAAAMGLTDGVMTYDEVLALMRDDNQPRASIVSRPAKGVSRMAIDTKSLARMLADTIGRAMGDEIEDSAQTAEPTHGTPPNTGTGIFARVKGVAQGPLAAAMAKAGIVDAEDFTNLVTLARIGEDAVTSARTYAGMQATRNFGGVRGPKIAAGLAHASIEDIMTSALAWEAEADTKYGAGKDGAPATRMSGSAQLPPIQTAETISAESVDPVTEHKRLMGMTNLGKRTMAGGSK